MSMVGIMYINKYIIVTQNHLSLAYNKEIEKSISTMFNDMANDIVNEKKTNITSYSKYFCKNRMLDKYLEKDVLKEMFIDSNVTLIENLYCEQCNGHIKYRNGNCNKILFSWTN